MKIGVISDTHGLLRPEAISALQGSDWILHAGDIGSAQILEQLAAIAPVLAVKGNNDERAEWAQGLNAMIDREFNGLRLLMVHDIADAERALQPDTRVVITGHSHKPVIRWQGERLYLNPGSAGPRRFKLPVTVAHLWLDQPAPRASLSALLD
ncbi:MULTISPECIES: metallophosphoesterase family protein [unclassified Pseudomonas]|uniref:metallophosphoesterase family protein n=1 Tax=unclassified Pseudomonas TaxID=196821 RepID=UPI000BD4659B|nr:MULTISPECIES: metallophosphoesterase family protein [unclassified Pseudomonas]PVZ12493.1 hypothetical protein F474_03290 [Pseudomonas sp. URIL14HWK12:I12]PVZ23355.1 hypothetical protein F470_02912 [Pseudomonas sp. URIL14HWK12:I10]PVZ32685.1 hypothetical protein F472_03260 [Pseudomonas sp. URIL14HWK12:I11]SNZ13839.1 hypothetical protein SAMN05660463_02609 [Pseudomonas sp. URIL14HWK12:I9]